MDKLFAEFVGTAILVLLGNGVVANVVLAKTKGANSGWIVITFGWAMAVFVAVWCVGWISGAHINPAVTLGLWLDGRIDFLLAIGYVIAQFLGAMAGATLVFCFYRDHYTVTEDADAKLGTFASAPAIRNDGRNLFSEATGTTVLVLAVLLGIEPSVTIAGSTALTSQVAPVQLGPLSALPVGLLVLAIGLSLGGTTGYAINPARDLGPRLAHYLLPVPNKRDSDWGYAWIPVAGPMIGAAAAVILYKLL